jgi:hypothetical protein
LVRNLRQQQNEDKNRRDNQNLLHGKQASRQRRTQAFIHHCGQPPQEKNFASVAFSIAKSERG